MARINDPQTQALIRRLEASRRQMGRHVESFQHKLNVRERLKEKLGGKPLLLLGGSAAVGLLASRILRRPFFPRRNHGAKEAAKKTGLLGLLVPIALTLLKPWIKSVITSELHRRFMARFNPR